MPMYTFRRSSDGAIVRHRLNISSYESILSGEKKLLDSDNNLLEVVFDPGSIGFVLKDGVSGGWFSKAHKENKYRKKRYDEMGRRQEDHAFKTKLVPNYEGKLAGQWSDVQDYVHSTKGCEAAATYDSLVAKDK